MNGALHAHSHLVDGCEIEQSVLLSTCTTGHLAASSHRAMFGAAAQPTPQQRSDAPPIRCVLRRSPEAGFGISIADNEDSEAVVTKVHSRQAREAGVETGAIIVRVAGYDVERQGLAGVQEAVALSRSSFETEFVFRMGEPLPEEVSEEEMQAATVLQARFRGYRSRQQGAQQLYLSARKDMSASSAGGLWGDVRYEWGVDKHDAMLERLETIEHEIHRASMELSGASNRRAVKMRERAPLAVGRSGSSSYWDSRTGAWSRPNSTLADSVHDPPAPPSAEPAPAGNKLFEPGSIMAAWDGSLATTARRQNLPPPPLETLVAPDRAGAGGKAAPRRSLSRSLAVTATEPSVRGLGSGGGSSGSGSLKVNRRTQL